MNRELFKFSVVLEFPKASSKVFPASNVDDVDATSEKNFSMIFVLSYLPDPVMPEMMID